MHRCNLVLAIGLILSLSAPISAQEGTVEVIKKWLMTNAISLSDVRPGGGFSDLQPLKKVFRGVRVIGLGEATHGTHEFFVVKHRLLEFLVKELNVRTLAIETGVDATSDINDYVLGRSSDGAGALSRQGFWPFDTEEMRAMLDWLRAHNATVPQNQQVRVTGFDIHFNYQGKQRILDYLRRVAPERVAATEALFQANIEKELEAVFFTKSPQERSNIIAKLATAKEKYSELLGFFALNQMRFTNQTSANEFSRVFESARVLAQLADSSGQPLEVADGPLRDYYMAENIKRLVDAAPLDTRIVVWAHNQHIGLLKEGENYPYMGVHLRRFYGDAYYALGFSFNKGSFQAHDYNPKANRELKQFTVGPAPENSVDWYFALAGMKNYFVDFRLSKKNETVKSWLATSRPMRLIGSYYNAEAEKHYFMPTKLAHEFDGILFIDETTRARPNPSVTNAAQP